jgi:hypothetical protein
MARQVININNPEDLINVGISANDSRGDPLRSAFIKLNTALDKIDSNFTELYAEAELHDYLGNFVFTDNNLSIDNSDELVISSKTSPTITLNINDITNSNPCEVFAAPTSGTLWSAVSDGYRVKFNGITTMTELNGNSYYIQQSTANSFYLYLDNSLTEGVDSSAYTAYSSTETETATNEFITGGAEFKGSLITTPTLNNVVTGWTVSGPGITGTQTVTSTLQDGNFYLININALGGGFNPATSYTFNAPSAVDGGGTALTSVPGGDIKIQGGGNTNSSVGQILGNLNFIGHNIDLTADTHTLSINNNGILTLPGNTNNTYVQQRQSRVRTTYEYVEVGTPKVVWTSTETFISSAKLQIQVEGKETGDPDWNTQACEAIIAAKGMHGTGEPAMTVYGVVATSANNLTIFSIQRNATTDLIEVVATSTPTATASTQQQIIIHSTELTCWD